MAEHKGAAQMFMDSLQPMLDWVEAERAKGKIKDR